MGRCVVTLVMIISSSNIRSSALFRLAKPRVQNRTDLLGKLIDHLAELNSSLEMGATDTTNNDTTEVWSDDLDDFISSLKAKNTTLHTWLDSS